MTKSGQFCDKQGVDGVEVKVRGSGIANKYTKGDKGARDKL